MNYNHVEAFCLMNYKCRNCGHREQLWNSRDGVTPFIIDCIKCDGENEHVHFWMDKRKPFYRPYRGQRIFVDMTEERYLEMMQKRMEYFIGTEHEIPEEKRPEFLEEAVKDMRKGEPDIKVWGKGI